MAESDRRPHLGEQPYPRLALAAVGRSSKVTDGGARSGHLPASDLSQAQVTSGDRAGAGRRPVLRLLQPDQAGYGDAASKVVGDAEGAGVRCVCLVPLPRS